MVTKNKGTNVKDSNIWVQLIWFVVLSGVIIVGLLFLIISKWMLPDTSELENPKYDLATQFYDMDNEVLGKIFTKNREWLTYEQINPYLVKGLVATEDERFFSHSGIDARGTLRAMVYMGKRGGASTITQQLAKLFFTERSSSFIPRVWQKLKEWVIAVEFERRYTKEEIIAMYLNKNDFIYASIGVATAAKTYFSKNQKDLTVDEAAVLIGMLKNPNFYNPKRNPEVSTARRNVVLKQMLRNDFITEEEYKNYGSKPINLQNFAREEHYTGAAPYFRAQLVEWTKDILNNPKYSKPDGSKYNVYTDGLKIYTTIDADIQQYAEASVREHMAKVQERFFKVWEGRDPWNYNAWKQAAPEEKNQRNALLKADMRNSERFKHLRKTYLDKVSGQIMADIPKARLTDNDIFRLYAAADDKKYLAKAVKDGLFSEAMADTYSAILASSHWKNLKKQWDALKKKADQEFAKKTTMVVYDYKTGGEKTTLMSPIDSIKYHQQILQIGSTVCDASSGAIRAWVGGVNYKYFQYDHVTSNRQVGSTFKPFIYATAIIDQAMSPCTKLQDIRTCIEKGDPSFNLTSTWCPDNSNNKYSGEWMNLKTALTKSTNTISVQLMKEIGNVERVKELVSNLGIPKDKIPSYPSICLGTPGLSVFDMASAYTTFANNGTHSTPHFVSRIEDKDGRIIYSHAPEQRKTINPAYNYVIVDLLKSVAGGIQKSLQSVVAGKTGTTNDYRDGWFVGFTPQFVISTWVGGEKEFVRFTKIEDGQGAVMARPIFVSLLQKIEKNLSKKYDITLDFAQPEEQLIELDCSKYDAIPSTEVEKSKNLDDEFDEEFDQ